MSSIREATEAFDAIEAAWKRGARAALVTLVAVRGSAYRRPGAKMMMASDNFMWGTLSGGCLEGDLYGWAEKAMEEGRPRIQSYDLGEKEMWSLGIGCKGSIDVLIEPLSGPDDAFWMRTREAVRQGGAVTTVLELPSGVRAGMGADGGVWGDYGALPEVVKRVVEHNRKQATRAETVDVDGHRFVIDTMRPPERLVVSGAGHDAIPLVRLAASVDFEVTVLDPRESLNTSERLPEAAHHLVEEPAAVDPARLRQAFWVIMNHFQERDEAALALALKAEPQFIGVLGPLERTQEMLEHIHAGLDDGPIRAPVGLDLGAETVEEVAVSVVAELMAARRRRSAQPLHGRGKIHA